MDHAENTAQSVDATGVSASVDSAPVASSDRIGSLDFIRGLAVMGILAANIIAFGQPFSAYMMPSQFMVDAGPGSDWFWVAQFVLIDGKMRGLFTLLFGAGLYLFMERAWARGESRWRQVRRLLFLMMFGLIHFYFIWAGDILFLYAATGLIVLLFVKMKPMNQLVLGLIGYVVSALAIGAFMASPALIMETEWGEQPQFAEARENMVEGKIANLQDQAIQAAMISEGRYTDWVGHTFSHHGAQPLIAISMMVWESLPLMLIGMALYRMGFFSGAFSARKMKLWGWAGLAVGAALSLVIALHAKANGFTYYGTLAAHMGYSFLPRLIMTVSLAALLVVWAQSATGWLGARVSAAGRAAFTNYLGTSIVMMFVFHGWALGLFGKLNRAELYLVVLLAWVLMLAWSKPWLERYRYGPLEWLWRCLTYGKRFALRR